MKQDTTEDEQQTPEKPKRAGTGRGPTLKPLSERKESFQTKNAMIMLHVTKHLEDHKRFPPYSEIAVAFEITTRSVVEHMKYFQGYTAFSEQLKTLTPMILQQFGVRTISKGRSQDVIAWMKLVEGWIDPNVLAAAAIPPAPTDATPIGELTAKDDELRHLETEYWLTLRRRAQESAGSDALLGEEQLQTDGAPYLSESSDQGGDSGEA